MKGSDVMKLLASLDVKLIKCLILDRNKIGNLGGVAIRNFIKAGMGVSNLRELRIRECNIGNEESIGVLNDLADLKNDKNETRNKLEVLDITRNMANGIPAGDAVVRLLEGAILLKELNLSLP